MTKQYLKPLALALGVALAGTACSKHDDANTAAPAGNPPPASTAAPAPSGSTAAAHAGPSFNIADLDTGIDACNDFNGFVNAKWVAANPIPEDRTRWDRIDSHPFGAPSTSSPRTA